MTNAVTSTTLYISIIRRKQYFCKYFSKLRPTHICITDSILQNPAIQMYGITHYINWGVFIEANPKQKTTFHEVPFKTHMIRTTLSDANYRKWHKILIQQRTRTYIRLPDFRETTPRARSWDGHVWTDDLHLLYSPLLCQHDIHSRQFIN